jgi:hypothetical protein
LHSPRCGFHAPVVSIKNDNDMLSDGS